VSAERIERKLAAILVADIVGYSRLAGADEDRILARLRALRSDLIDPTIAVHHGRIVKRTGDGSIIEFRSVVDAVRCAIEMQNGMLERNAGLPPERRIEFRIGIHLGDVVEETDGDLMGDGVNIAARLEGLAEPGTICLSEDAYRQVKARLDLKVSDLGPTRLKNIADPIRVYSLKIGEPAIAKSVASQTSQGSTPPRLSIVVLPFVDMGGDPSQDYFTDGVTESLTTDLSRMSGAMVIGRNTAFTYKGKAVDLKQIGRELNVRYVLEGSVQRGGNRMRINAQLVDAATGNHIWAERFDKPTADLFDLQDEIVARLANMLQTQLGTAEARRAERAANPDSMDLYFRGMAWFNRGFRPDYLSKAVDFFERALLLDPENVDALVGLSHANAIGAGTHVMDDWAARFARAEVAASTALSLAPDHAAAHLSLGVVQSFTNRAALGIAECERALTLDRNLAAAHAYIGMAKYFTGRAEETEAHLVEAFRLSPRDTLTHLWLGMSGVAKVFLGRDDEAISRLQRSIEANRSSLSVHFYLGVALTRLGRLREARVAIEAGLGLDPTFTIRRYRDEAPSDNPTFLAMRERIYDAMRKAGVPEG
jgi:TolB-like protein/class 3 adenylate cyclase